MQNNSPLSDSAKMNPPPSPVLEIRVNNHPGVMSHICGLFSRRACNVQKILCLPLGDGQESRIWLTLIGRHPMDQIMKQLMKLEDVLEVKNTGREEEIFGGLPFVH